MSKEKLLKEIFEHYGYEYEILEDGSIKEFNDEGRYTLYNRVEDALKEWLLTLEESNKCCINEKVPLLWSEEEIELITSI